MILVSIIVPVYNMGSKLETCLESLLKQTYRNLEIILVDDGSSDDSLAICEKIATTDNRLKVIHTENQGAGKARNSGIEVSTGDYVYFPDADDELSIQAIEELVECATVNQSDLVVFGYKCINTRENISSLKEYEEITLLGADARNNYQLHFSMNDRFAIQGAPWNKFFDLKKIKEKSIRYPDLRRHQDEIFIMRYMNYAEKVVFLNKALYTYYINDINLIWNKFPENYSEIINKVDSYRRDMILNWNINNKNIIKRINESYVLGSVKALELVYNEKFKFNLRMRFNWLMKIVSDQNLKSNFANAEMDTYLYQRTIVKLVNGKHYKSVFLLLGLKVFVNKNFTQLFVQLKKINNKK
ncbi:glycosyltransferase family 2 protein [Paenibacillus sp. PL91]|uniref:glycosyltransferase family 2 protein n=1 Tax=Paenibacillus sp. PL91 TaxID=2729538 RepID=UPI00145CEE55|nr:glycosyltransferase [Paenibacillus sp. PL91]MBC9202870.1 glycosyltransferase [Paenibacillus sp. PL91]